MSKVSEYSNVLKTWVQEGGAKSRWAVAGVGDEGKAETGNGSFIHPVSMY